MKRIIFVLVFLVLASFGGVFAYFQVQPEASLDGASGTVLGERVAQVLPIVTPTPTPLPVGDPVRLSIAALGVDAVIEEVGLEPNGRMAVPRGWDNVGWYKYGPKPGEGGSSVVAGHLDSPTGPAVFYRLESLSRDDEIVLEDSLGRERKFRVTETAVYSDQAFPIDEVFGSYEGKRLVLITCEGIFDRTTRNYSDRLVVYADMVE